MDDVARARHQAEQPIRRRLAPLGRGRGLHRVDIEVQGAWMTGRLLDQRLQHLDDLAAMPLGGRSVRLPVVPGLGVHHGLGVEGPGVEILMVRLPQLAHGLGEGLVQRLAVGLGVGGVTGRQGLDPGALFRRGLGLQGLRLLQRLPGRLHRIVRHREIDVGAEGEGHPPPAHGAVRIQPRALPERADGLGVVEAEQQLDPLIEEHLGLGVPGRDRVMVVAQVVEHRRAGLVRLAGIDRRHGRQAHVHRTGHGHARHVHRGRLGRRIGGEGRCCPGQGGPGEGRPTEGGGGRRAGELDGLHDLPRSIRREARAPAPQHRHDNAVRRAASRRAPSQGS